MERVVGWERQPQGSQQGIGEKQQGPSSSGVHAGQGSCRGQVGQELALTSMVLSSDPTLLRRPRFPAPTSKEPSVRVATPPPHPAGLLSWAPGLGPSRGQTPYSLSPIEEGGWGGGEVEKEEQKEEEMEEEERWCRRNRRGKRGEVEQQRGAKAVAPLHTPWPKPWAPPVLTWLPGPLQRRAQGSG